MRITDHQSKNTSEDYLKTLLLDLGRGEASASSTASSSPARRSRNMPFEQVRYWREMLEIMAWTETNVHHTMFICWGAQAALHHFHQARRYRMENKAFGVFRHKLVGGPTPWLRGFSDSPMIPVSRYNDIDKAQPRRPTSTC